MINVVIEGYAIKEKEYVLKKLRNKLKKNNICADKNTPQKKKTTNFSTFFKNTQLSETLKQSILDYLKYRQENYNKSNKVNILEKSYLSILNEKNMLFDSKYDGLLKNIKLGEQINLLVFINPNKNKTNSAKTLEEYIRINNHEYCLMAFIDLKNLDIIVEKIYKKILELLADEEKTQEDKWEELYRIDIEEFNTPDDYITYKLKYKKKFIKKVLHYSKRGKVLEAGCGTGLMAGYLQKLGCKVTAIDISQKILDLAKEIATNSSVIEPCEKYEKMDILDLKYKPKKFDVSISNGALEHFSDYDIINILGQQMKIANYVIFGIPSTYFGMNEKMLGNERSLKLKEWKNLIEKANGELVECTSFHYYKFFQRLFEVKKWFKPKAFWLFILKAKNN